MHKGQHNLLNTKFLGISDAKRTSMNSVNVALSTCLMSQHKK